MDLLLKQIEGLILGSIPTVVFFITLVIAYGYLVRRPLDKVLAERAARDDRCDGAGEGCDERGQRRRRLFLRTSCAARRRRSLQLGTTS